MKICYHRPRQQKHRLVVPLYEIMTFLYPELLCATLVPASQKLGVLTGLVREMEACIRGMTELVRTLQPGKKDVTQLKSVKSEPV